MGLSRRFLNLIVESDEAYTRSLHRIDLKRLQLFYPTPPPPPSAPIRRQTTTIERIRLPDPILKFRPHSHISSGDRCSLACYAFGQRKVLATDQDGRNFLYDVNTRDVAAMPMFHKPKLRNCLSLFVPCGGDGEGDDHECDGGGSLYLMVRELREVKRYDIEVGQPSMDFEVLFYGNGRTTSQCKLLPLPPFVLPIQPNENELPFMLPIKPNERPKIGSYAVVGGGSHICVSVDGRGTYTLDTSSHTWDEVGVWTLPFHGKVEYVPELKLWFGLSGHAQNLAAADLSVMDAYSPPQLAAGLGCEEFQPPEEWAEQELDIDQKDVQLVNLGSGRFCIARFFVDWRLSDDGAFYFVVLTGVEVIKRVLDNGKVKLEMIPHKSMCRYKSPVDGTHIEQLF